MNNKIFLIHVILCCTISFSCCRDLVVSRDVDKDGASTSLFKRKQNDTREQVDLLSIYNEDENTESKPEFLLNERKDKEDTNQVNITNVGHVRVKRKGGSGKIYLFFSKF